MMITMTKQLSKFFYWLTAKSQKTGDFFNKNLVDEITWRARMHDFKLNLIIVINVFAILLMYWIIS